MVNTRIFIAPSHVVSVLSTELEKLNETHPMSTDV